MIDRDGRLFHVILNFLRDGAAVLPSDEADLEALVVEARYYLLPDLAKQVRCSGSGAGAGPGGWWWLVVVGKKASMAGATRKVKGKDHNAWAQRCHAQAAYSADCSSSSRVARTVSDIRKKKKRERTVWADPTEESHCCCFDLCP